jgi:hypothetical protein
MNNMKNVLIFQNKTFTSYLQVITKIIISLNIKYDTIQ